MSQGAEGWIQSNARYLEQARGLVGRIPLAVHLIPDADALMDQLKDEAGRTGPALIWIPAVIYLFIVGQTLAAVGLLVWCATVVSLLDNFLRPRLIGRDTRMSDLLILLSTLRGIIRTNPWIKTGDLRAPAVFRSRA